MANTLSAEKRNRQRLKRRARNLSHLGPMRTKVKRAHVAINDPKAEAADIGEKVSAAVRQLAKAAAKGAIPKRQAARKISRLTLGLNKASSENKSPSAATPKKQAKGKQAQKGQGKAAKPATKAPESKAVKATEASKAAKAPSKDAAKDVAKDVSDTKAAAAKPATAPKAAKPATKK